MNLYSKLLERKDTPLRIGVIGAGVGIADLSPDPPAPDGLLYPPGSVDEYIRRCFAEYGVKTDPGGRYACMYKRWHLIGLEVGISSCRPRLFGERARSVA